MKTAMAILASPRKKGNVAGMLHLAVAAAQRAGYQIEYFDLYEQNIAWCTGCMGCKQTGICTVRDDIDVIRDVLLRCDLVITASPTYFANVPAALKNMFDRLVGAIMDDNSGPIPKAKLSRAQQYLLLAACNTPFPFDRLAGQSSGTLRNMKEFYHTAGMKCLGKIVFAGTRGKKQIPRRIAKKIERLF